MVEGKVAVLGLGYAGLSFTVAVASKGFRVIGVDVDERKVKLITQGEAPFHEPGLEELLVKVLNNKLLEVTTKYRETLRESNIVFIFVGTPSRPDGSCDLKYVENASKMVGEVLRDKNDYQLIVIRSTVPPGTTENFVKRIIEDFSGRVCGKDFGLCMNPEFMREGKALYDVFHPSRIVIGEYDRRSGNILEKFYRRLHGDRLPPIIRTSIVNAELIKYVANTFLALKVSFINLIARIAQILPGADVTVVAKGIGLDPRIGEAFLGAGLGFGGSCLPKDLKAFIKFAEELDEDATLLKAILDINDGQIDNAIYLLKKGLCREDLRDVTVAVLGLAYKPGTDDIRESQSIKLVKKLVELGVNVKVHDPKALEGARKVLRSMVRYCNDIYECIRGVEAIIIATDWPEYRKLDLDRAKNLVHTPLIVDCRRILIPEHARSKGFKYLGIGLSLEY